MNRTTSITLTALLVVAAVAVPLGAASVVPSGSVQDGTEPDGGNESIAPGERFAAAVAVQNAAVNGDVSERAFGVRLANAASNETKAAVVAEQVETSERRLDELEAELEDLNESREAGEISEGRYRAEVATAVAELRAIERRAAAAETAAADLPESAFAERPVDVERIRALRDRAGELGGPETAEIARSIVGDDVGRPVGDDRGPGGPNGDRGESGSDERTGGEPGRPGASSDG